MKKAQIEDTAKPSVDSFSVVDVMFTLAENTDDETIYNILKQLFEVSGEADAEGAARWVMDEYSAIAGF